MMPHFAQAGAGCKEANGRMPESQAVPRPGLGRAVLAGGLTGLCLALGLHAVYVLLGPNFHTVLPGAVSSTVDSGKPT